MRKLLPVFLLLALMACAPSQGRYVQIQGFAQGGTYTVKLNTKGVGEKVETIRDSIESLLLQIDTTLSGYNKRSMLSRFNAGEAVPATPLFLDMYRCAYRYWERSGGLLDCAAGPLFNAWGFGFREQQFPSEEEIRALQDRCGMRLLPAELPVKDGKVDPADVSFPQLNYNAIAQGYSCDVIARYLYSLGVKDMLVDIGEIWCDGLNPSGKPWSVGVNYRKFYIKDGKKFAHTVNPLTGYPVQHNLLSATVVSQESAAEADAIATWCMVAGLEAAQKLILDSPALEGYLISATEDGGMTEWASPGFTLKQ